MSSSYSVTLGGPGPWGFRLQGGKDFNMPLTISRLTDGGKAARAHISVGDVLLSIDGVSTDGMNHLEAQNKIKSCPSNLKLTLKKASTAPKAASPPKDEPPAVVNPAPVAKLPPPTAYTPPAPSAIYNKTARPFGGGGGGGGAGGGATHVSAPKTASVIPSATSAFTPTGSARDHARNQTPPPFNTGPAQTPPPFTRSPASTAAVKPSPGRSPLPASSSSSSSSPSTWSPARVTGTPPSGPVQSQSSVYNSPIKLYSAENACEVAIGQSRGLPGGGTDQLNGSPRRHIIDTEPEFHPTSPSDSSRKRLVEDTEDWHPRAGTCQSRSFRLLAQITGTEHQDDQQGENVKNETEAHPSAHITPPMKTMTKTPPAGVSRNGSAVPHQTPSTQGSPAPWKTGQSAGVPNVGRVSDSAPSGRNAPQQQPSDGRDSLVQRAEHMPAGTRTPLCGHCNKLIRGPFLVALGRSWHPEEFVCAHCRTSLAERSFMQEQGGVYCEQCFEEFFAPDCARCHGKIVGEVINALKQTWHMNCFLCASCQQPIRDKTFHLEEGQPYCERDYSKLFATNCHGCDFAIEPGDQFLEALGWSWHDTCFVCAVCCTNLGGQAFFSKKNKPLCKKHAQSINV